METGLEQLDGQNKKLPSIDRWVGLYGPSEVTPTALRILRQAGIISSEVQVEALADAVDVEEANTNVSDVTYIAGYPKIAA